MTRRSFSIDQEKSQIDIDQEAEIEREVERRVRIREQEIRERNYEKGARTATVGMYVVLALLLFTFSNQLWPEITRTAIILLGGGAIGAGLFVVIGNFSAHDRSSGKSRLALLGTVFGAMGISMPLVLIVGETYWPEEIKKGLIAMAAVITIFLFALVYWKEFGKGRSDRY